MGFIVCYIGKYGSGSCNIVGNIHYHTDVSLLDLFLYICIYVCLCMYTDVHRAQELFPLVVMDVYVQLPGKVGLSNLGGTSSNLTGMMGGTGGLQRNSTASSIGSVGSINSSTTAPTSSSSTGLLAVELQQVVGAFSCETDRCPPNLDCGLLEWDHFYHLHQQRVTAATAPPPSTAEATIGNISRLGSHSKKLSLASVSTGSSTASNLRSATSSTSWTPTNSETGNAYYIYVYSVLLPLYDYTVFRSCLII